MAKRKNTVIKMITSMLLCASAFSAFSCADADTDKKGAYERITPDEAKQIMDSEKNYVILDVRTEDEYAQGHIKNSILIPDYDISEKAEEILKDKDQLILVYCRSGRRSRGAAKELVELGYTNVKDFGGIIDWNYETVK